MEKKTSPGDINANSFYEPENYKELRGEIESLMERVNTIKIDFTAIAGTGIILERFQEKSRKIEWRLARMISTLGEMYGYCLTDDVIENVHQNKQ